MLASFQSFGTWPVLSEMLNIISRMGEMSWLSSFKTFWGIKSGNVALCGFKLASNFWMPGLDIVVFGI